MQGVCRGDVIHITALPGEKAHIFYPGHGLALAEFFHEISPSTNAPDTRLLLATVQ
jgi:hypothetical protein